MPAADAPDPPAHAPVSPTADDRFLLLLDTLPYPAFVIAAGSQVIHYNSRFVEYLGFVPGPTREDRTALSHPEDQPALEAARAEAVPRDLEYVVEGRLRRHDGVFRWHRVHNKPLFRDGRRIAYLGTAVDIDDARRANEVLEARVRERTAALEAANAQLAAEEARYRALYNRTPMALHSSDCQWRS